MADITPERIKIQQQETRQRTSLTESLFARVGASINWIIENATEQVGDVVTSTLTEAQFQEQRNNKWVLMDGRDVSGSDYAAITGFTNIPDGRGVVLRGKNNGRDDAFADDEGERQIGSLQMDQMQRLTGQFRHRSDTIGGSAGIEGGAFSGSNSGAAHGGASSQGRLVTFNSANSPNARVSATTEGETRMRNVCVNYFIKINA